MEPIEQRLDEAQLRAMSTGELVRHALEEARLLARAEILHAKQELRDEVTAAKTAGILIGVALTLALAGVALLLVALALALPLPEPGAAVLVGVGALLVAAGCGLVAFKRMPKRPLPRTQQRLRVDLARTKEMLT